MADYYQTAFVYFIQHGDDPLVKIGTTVEEPTKRLAALQVGNPMRLRLLGAIDLCAAGTTAAHRAEYARIAKARESELHRRFSDERLDGEWFRLSPRILAFIEQERNFPSKSDAATS